MVRKWQQQSYVGGLGAKPPEARGCTEIFCIFYLKEVIFSAFNCIICCDNVLCTMYYTNTKCSDMRSTQDLARRGLQSGVWGRSPQLQEVKGPTNEVGQLRGQRMGPNS